MDFDIIIVGGGPAGLSFAASLANSRLRVAVLERQSAKQLAEPLYDGREIALTHRSRRILSEIGAWQNLAADEISALRSAAVLNGDSPLSLRFDTAGQAQEQLGWLVSNHQIRKALHGRVTACPNVTLLTQTAAKSVSAGVDGAEVALESGERLTARLVVAADSRFSTVRDQLGIAAEMKRTGTAMLVCRVSHEKNHDRVATEWFSDPHTIAMLPLNGRVSSAVLTLPIPEAERLAELDDEALAAEIAARFDYRLGAMKIASTRHVYPLVMTWSRRFAVPGAALIGDTAVGMHPVTAHGYNLGLSGQEHLAVAIRDAMRIGRDWGSIDVLRTFERAHRRDAWPIFRGTNLIVGLYRDRRPAARAARHIGIRLARRMPFFRTAMRGMLLQA